MSTSAADGTRAVERKRVNWWRVLYHALRSSPFVVGGGVGTWSAYYLCTVDSPRRSAVLEALAVLGGAVGIVLVVAIAAVVCAWVEEEGWELLKRKAGVK